MSVFNRVFKWRWPGYWTDTRMAAVKTSDERILRLKELERLTSEFFRAEDPTEEMIKAITDAAWMYKAAHENNAFAWKKVRETG